MRKSLFIFLPSLILLLRPFLLTEAELNNGDLREVRQNKNVMSGLHFRVPAYEFPPFLTIRKNRNGSFSYGGVTSIYINMISEYFNLKISYIHTDQNEIDHLGTPLVMVRMLVENEIDLSTFPLERKLYYSQKVDLLSPFWVSNFALMQPWPEEESRLTIPIRPFRSSIWLVLFGSILTFIGIASILYVLAEQNKGSGAQKSFKTTFFDQLQYVLSILTLQGSSVSRYHPSKRLSVRILVGSWLLAMLVLVYAYRGVLMSILFVPKLKPIVENWEQLAEQHEFKLTTDSNTTLTQLFMTANSGTFKKIGDSLDPNLVCARALTCIDNVIKHKCIYPTAVEIMYYFISNDFKANHNKCRVTAGSKGLMYYMSFHTAVAKNSPYTDIINQDFMLYFVETGLVNSLIGKSSTSGRLCRTDVKPTGKMSTFNLKDFSVAFFLYGIGASLSLLAFIFELIINAAGKCTAENKRNI